MTDVGVRAVVDDAGVVESDDRFVEDGVGYRVSVGVPRGVPLRELCARGNGVEPAIALSIVKTFARRAGVDGVGDVDHAFLSFDGVVGAWPPLSSFGSSPWGALVELFTHLLPETSPWWRDASSTSVAARALWTRMVGPYLGGLGNRAQQKDDLATVAQIAAAVDAIDARAPALRELRGLARGLFPDEWAREARLRDELALVDDRVFDDLVARAGAR